MVARYNLYNLEASFKKYLLAENVSSATVHNYLSDFRHFAGWFSLYIESHNNVSLSTSEPFLPSVLSKQTVFQYRAYLLENKLPVKTVNRRLSTLRKLSAFCINQGWLTENAAKQLGNIDIKVQETEEFEAFLLSKHITVDNIERITQDIKELEIINSNP